MPISEKHTVSSCGFFWLDREDEDRGLHKEVMFRLSDVVHVCLQEASPYESEALTVYIELRGNHDGFHLVMGIEAFCALRDALGLQGV